MRPQRATNRSNFERALDLAWQRAQTAQKAVNDMLASIATLQAVGQVQQQVANEGPQRQTRHRARGRAKVTGIGQGRRATAEKKTGEKKAA
jgi:hypothetical protein